MKHLTYILLITSIFFLTNSCKKTLDISIDESEKKLVVNSILNPDSLIRVNVTKSMGALEQDADIQFINDAKIKLYKDNNFVEDLIFQENGYYISTIYPEEGKTYKIEIEQSDLGTASSELTILQPVPISQINSNFKYEITEYVDEWGAYSDTSISATVVFEINDPANQDNYYAISAYTYYTNYYWDEETYEETDSIIGIWKNNLWISPSTVDYQYSNEIRIGEDYIYAFYKETGDGKTFSYTFDIYNLMKDQKVYFNLYSLDKNIFLYGKSYSEQIDASYTPFAQPVNVFTNIENGYGIFGSYSIYTDSLTVQ